MDTDISSHDCKCKDGCSTRRCGCVAAGILCGQRCECKHYGCHNQQQQSSAAKTTDETSQSRSQDEGVADLDTKKSSHACECKDGCSTRRCGCVAAGILCGQRCECKHYGCHNQITNSQQQSSAAETTDETSQSRSQDEGVAELDTKKSSHACECKDGCSTRRCGCVAAGILCGQRCECKHYGCHNQQQSSAAKTTDETSQSRSQDESVADLDTKKSSHACECKDGCSTRRCGCVAAGILCGQRCECKHYGCHNQQQSSAGKTTDESSQSRSQDESVADLDTKKSSQACECRKDCTTRRCGCVAASILCGQRCECKHYGCHNQQQSSAGKTTDESSQSRSQDESVADLDTKKSSQACECRKDCTTRRCGCVAASILCGQRCECKHYGCHNQQQSSAGKTTDESSQSRSQDESVADLDTKKSSHACECKKDCTTRRCGCVAAGILCGQRCECKHYGCDNQSSVGKTTDESSQSRSEDESVADLDTKKSSHACECKDGCSTRRCGCVAAGILCVQRCECKHYGCDNQQQSSAAETTDESSQSRSQDESVADLDTNKSSQACKCKAGCSTQRCDCVAAGILCGQRCECKHYGCDNQVETTESQQQSSAAETTDESSETRSQDESVADLDTKKSLHVCECKAGCSTRRCGCVAADILCGQRCECKHYGCDNQVETTKLQQQSSAAETTDESSQSRSQDESVADLDTKKSLHVCECKAGCSTRRCGCVAADILCGQRCECKHYGCDNQVETTKWQQQSSAAETTDESSQSRSQDESVADLDTKKSLHVCECKAGCSTRRCGCVAADILCGQRCECKHYGCDNQQQSSAAKTTDESSQSRSQDESVADLDTKKSSHDFFSDYTSNNLNKCKAGCSTRRCGCVAAGIPCGRRCECKHYGCDNQVETANSQQQCSAAKIADESSQSLSQNVSVADLVMLI